MKKQILNQRIQTRGGLGGLRTYDIRATMEFDDAFITEEQAKVEYLDTLRAIIEDPDSLIVVDNE